LIKAYLAKIYEYTTMSPCKKQTHFCNCPNLSL
jgi:hypothetical protein